MRLLLDTQALLSWTTRPADLPERVRTLLRDARNDIRLSAASVWELAIKQQTGKLQLPEEYLDALLGSDLRFLAMTEEHSLVAGRLPLHHHDPFDRMLIAQAQTEGMPLVGGDRAFAAYDVRVIW